VITLDYFNGQPQFVFSLNGGHGIYLDNWAIIDLAKGPRSRRDTFLEALRRVGSVLFSFANAAEIGGPRGASEAAVTDFLKAIGRYWVPFQMNAFRVEEREAAGRVDAPIATELFLRLAARRYIETASKPGAAALDASDLFDLSAVIPLAQAWHDDGAEAAELTRRLREGIELLATSAATPAEAADLKLPAHGADPGRRVGFVIHHLFRTLVKQAKSHRFKAGDGFDFCHAVMATAYASVATLDETWKQRVGLLPAEAQAPQVFYAPELDAFVDAVVALTPRAVITWRVTG
jgi:hypothetical protein